MKKRLLSLALAAVMVVMMGTPALAVKLSRDYPFADVPNSHWAYDAVYFCWSSDIVEGVSETEFSPNTTLTRAQFITMMGRAIFEDEIQAQNTSSNSWYSGYVRYLSSNGYLDGISTDEDSLSSAITRQEMALIVYNMCKEYNSDYDLDYSSALYGITDVSSIGSNYTEAIKYCYYTGVLTGYEDGSFNPTATLTRAEAAAVLKRACYWVNIGKYPIKRLIEAGISEEPICQIMSSLIIEDINDWREENGLKRLETLEFMNEAATVRAEECSISFSHTRPDGRAGGTVYEDLFGTQMGYSEIIVSNQNLLTVTLVEAADTFVEQWKNSSGHNAAMLGDHDYIGCGVYISSNNVYSAAHFISTYHIETYGYENYVT
ncbi:MAG: S-layer homology domain-containing protein [Oscillospiraceae bacterium]|nr:S-layer homology domain-containing protein [Oscillospiraceae bacterium]